MIIGRRTWSKIRKTSSSQVEETGMRNPATRTRSFPGPFRRSKGGLREVRQVGQVEFTCFTKFLIANKPNPNRRNECFN